MTPATLGTRRRLIAAEGPQGRARGFILIVVIWLVALLALMSGAFVRSVQGHVRSTAVHSQLARAETIADSGFALAVLDLAESRAAPGRERRFPVNGKAVTCQLGGSDRITVRVKDAGGLINLNTAGERLLQAFFIGLGASREIASRRADLLLDFRDADHDRRLNGAERPEYRAAGRSYGPKNAPLDSLDELSQILEFDAELIEQVLPYVTIHSGTAGLDPAVVSHALADIVNRGVDALPATGRPAAGDSNVPIEFVVSSTRRVYNVTVAGHVASGVMFVREAVVELLSNRDGLPTLKVWRQSFARTGFEPIPADRPLAPC